MKRTGPKPRPALERVLARIEIENECWIFTGHCHPHNGHGYVQTGSQSDGTRRPKPAHRVVYEALISPVPGLDLHHECRRPACVNPEHLKPLTRAEHGALHTGEAAEARKRKAALK